jgi:hypothetical protein
MWHCQKPAAQPKLNTERACCVVARCIFPDSAHACSEIGLKWFLFFFCLSAFDLDCLIVGLGCVETDSARRSKTDVRLKTASKSPKKNKYHF